MNPDELVTLYLAMRSVEKMGKFNWTERKYKDHPFCVRLQGLMFSAFTVQGLSYRRMAEEIGVSYSTISAYRAGVCLPGAEVLLKLADYFGVSTDYLLGREGYEMEDEKNE